MIWGPKRTCVPNFDRAWAEIATTRHDLRSIWRERDGIDPEIVGVLLLALQLECTCQASHQASVLAKKERFGAKITPESQTLIVWSREPETIVFPSGLNATLMTQLLWAFSLVALSSRVPAREGRKLQFRIRQGDFRANLPASQTLIVLSWDPDTILLPSGENCTEAIEPLWASFFSLLSSSVAVREGRNG